MTRKHTPVRNPSLKGLAAPLSAGAALAFLLTPAPAHAFISFSGVVEFFEDAGNSIASGLSSAGDGIADGFESLGDEFKKLEPDPDFSQIEADFASIGGGVMSIGDWFSDDFVDFWEHSVPGWVVGYFDASGAWVEETFTTWGGVVYSYGVAGRTALNFDGVDAFATIGDSDALDFDAAEDFTVALWVQAGDVQAAGERALVEKKHAYIDSFPYMIRLDDVGKINARRSDGTRSPIIGSSTVLDDGEYHHVLFTRNDGVLQLYIDGVLEDSTADTTTGTTTNDASLYLGGNASGGGGYFNGAIDGLMILPGGATAEMAQTMVDAVETQGDDDMLVPGERLLPGEAVVSSDGRFWLWHQGDGNVVLYGPDGVMWASGSNGYSTSELVMQRDGDLVLYDSDGLALRASDTAGAQGTNLLVQNDGNVVLYQNGAAIWATDTNWY